MGWETFTSNLVGDLAWPAVVAAALVIFRKPISALIRSLKSLRWREWEADFEGRVEEAKEVAEALPATLETTVEFPAPTVTTASWGEDLEGVAEDSPTAAVLDAWRRVEGEVRRLAQPYGRGSTIRAAQRLAEGGVIPRPVLSVILDLGGLRNQLAHNADAEISTEAALSYISAARSVVATLRNLPPGQPGRDDPGP